MNATTLLKKSLDEKALAYHRQRAADARKHAQICKIKETYPDDAPGGSASRDVQRLRVMAALIEFGEIGTTDANLRLRVVSEGSAPDRLTWSLEHIAQELIDEGFSIKIEKRSAEVFLVRAA